MEAKKNRKTDLENKKRTFLLFGLVFSLSLVLLAFEWKTKPSLPSSLGTLEVPDLVFELPPITRPLEQKQEIIQPQAVEVIKIVDNATDILSSLDIFNTEIDGGTGIDVMPIVYQIKDEKEVENEMQVHIIVEEMPEFPGGQAALAVYLRNNLQYPPLASDTGISGKVYVQFVVNKDGSITDVQVTRGVDASLDKEAVRVVANMPKWKPGKQGGKPVRVSYSLPVNFILQ